MDLEQETVRAVRAMMTFAVGTVGDVVASALGPVAESSDSTHWARALVLWEGPEKVEGVTRHRQEENHE